MPSSPSSSCIAGRRSSAMSATHTFAPSRTNLSATARPMPDAPPVISATSPSSQPISPPPSESQKPVHEHHHAPVLHARLDPLERLRGGSLEHLAVDRAEARAVHRALDLAAAAHAAVAELELRVRAVAVEHRRALLGHRDHDVAALDHVRGHEARPQVVDRDHGHVLPCLHSAQNRTLRFVAVITVWSARILRREILKLSPSGSSRSIRCPVYIW